MRSTLYRQQIRAITTNIIRRKLPGLKPIQIKEIATQVAISIHARLYGADVDGVASPIWRDDPNYSGMFVDRQPTKTATEILSDV